MNANLGDDDIPRLARGYRLQWEQAQDCHVVLYPEGMVKLSGSAAAILTRCDGERSVAEIVAALSDAYPGADLRNDVMKFLNDAFARGWLSRADMR